MRDFVLRCEHLGTCVDVSDIPPDAWRLPGFLKTCAALAATDGTIPGRGYFIDEMTLELTSLDPRRWRQIGPDHWAALEIGLGPWTAHGILEDSPSTAILVQFCNQLLEGANIMDTLTPNPLFGYKELGIVQPVDKSAVHGSDHQLLAMLDQAWWSLFACEPPAPAERFGVPVDHRRITWEELTLGK